VLVIVSWDTEIIIEKGKKPKVNLKLLNKINKLIHPEFRYKYDWIKYNWFLQSDSIMKDTIKDIDFMFELSLFNDLRNDGDEIGLHFHPILKNKGIWYQSEEIDKLSRFLNEIKKKVKVNLVRTGWNYGNTELINLYNSLGFSTDASCCPGKYSEGTQSSVNWMGIRNFYDWEDTPNYPYHPSKEDYKREGDLNILEIPITTIGGYSLQFHGSPSIMKKIIETTFRTSQSQDCIVILHGYSHNFDINRKGYKNFCRNLSYIKKMSEEYGVEFEYKTISEVRDIWLKQGKPYKLFRTEIKETIYNKLSRKLNPRLIIQSIRRQLK